jgi:hypothetical protein
MGKVEPLVCPVIALSSVTVLESVIQRACSVCIVIYRGPIVQEYCSMSAVNVQGPCSMCLQLMYKGPVVCLQLMHKGPVVCVCSYCTRAL